MRPYVDSLLKATLPLPDNDVPVVQLLVPSHTLPYIELTPAVYQAVVCAILNTPADAEPWPVYKVRADDEVLHIPANGIFHAFAIARALRPQATVVTDTAGR